MTNENVDTKTKPPKKRAKVLWIVSIIFIVAALIWGLLWLFHFRFYESTNDAYANGNLININSAISGSVIAFYADNTDLVVEGQLLVELDGTDYQVIYEKELATLGATVLQVRQLYEAVLANTANVENKRILLERADFDYQNRSRLIDSGAVSNEEFIHAKDDYLAAEVNYEQAEFQLAQAIAAAGNSGIEDHPLIEEQKRNVHNAYYNVRHCQIYAPATGYIAERAVDVGEWVSPSTNLMAVIPTDYVWVDANYKETQLRKMRIGQDATVWFDIYGSGVKYHGKVLGIASGTGSVFSIIPPQNATGNWIKIVQRLPVRISLDAQTVQNYPVRIGLSAEVRVNITQEDLPLLARAPSFRPVATTDIFTIDWDEVNKMIETVIKENLARDP